MKVVNEYKKLRDNWYSWTVSIQGTDQELEQIKYVTYLLHETFLNRRIVSTSAANKFARTTEGWGEFLLRAEAMMKSEKIKCAELWLDLGFEHTKAEKRRYTGDFEDFLCFVLKLKDKKPDVRMRAVIDLGRTGDARAIEPLIPALKDKDYVRNKAEVALENICADAVKMIGADAVKPLIGALKNKSPKVRSSAARTLGRIGSRLILDSNVKVIIGEDVLSGIIGDIVNALTAALKKEWNLFVHSIIKNALNNIKAKQKSK